MLREHLSQLHDRGSRRFEIVDQQVAWIHQVVLRGEPGRVLDLGCGPGLYTSRLARLGHQCTGLDIAPAAIDFAKREAEESGLDCTYERVDLRSATLGQGFDAVLMVFGEFNSLPPTDAESLLHRVGSALSRSGRLLLELQFYDYVRALGQEGSNWAIQPAGVFSDFPHLVLQESHWHADAEATTQRYMVLTDESVPEIYSHTTRAYSDGELDEMLSGAGLTIAGRYESLSGDSGTEAELFGLVAEPLSEIEDPCD
ncbi:class I SAM-dependent methyltransferase [Myxococcota bacterium]|nr:class I SAM-dependent methyltransferase [Myxococcota bacterium]